MPVDKVIKFFHGASTGIEGKITDGTINESDLIITSDTDELVYVDETKTPKTLGSSKTKEVHEVNLGGSIGGLSDGTEIPTGTTLDEFIAMLTQKAVPATYTQPGVTCRVSSGTSAGNYEVGTEINTTIQGTFTQNDAAFNTCCQNNQSRTANQEFSSVGIEGNFFFGLYAVMNRLFWAFI